jgi:hypothetical protein
MQRMLTFVACLLAAPAVTATVLVPAEFREVVTGSEVIAYGRVIEVRPEWAEGRRRIDSVVTFEVASYLKGGSERTVSFKVPGGQLGRYRSVMIGAPVFTPGDEAVLFLRTQPGAMPHVFGLNQGVYRVRLDPSGRRMVLPPALLVSGDSPEIIRRGSVGRRPVDLDAFGAQVRSVLAAQPGGIQ